MYRKFQDIFIGKDFSWWLKLLKKIIRNPHFILARLHYNIKRGYYDSLSRNGRVKYKYKIIFIAGMPMSATTWIKTMVARIPGYFVRTAPMPYSVAANQDISESAFKYTPDYGYSIFKTHLNPSEENIKIILDNNVEKVIVSYRDLRDVIVARYHRLIKIPKTKRDPHYIDYSSISKEDAINHCIDVVTKDYIPWIEGWFLISSQYKGLVHFCRFEDLLMNPTNEFKKILDFYEVSLPPKDISKIILQTKGSGDMVKNIYKGTLQSWAYSSNFRSGKIGGWKSDFTQKNIDYYKEKEKKTLIYLGYERDNNW
jgi:hypothetical protein